MGFLCCPESCISEKKLEVEVEEGEDIKKCCGRKRDSRLADKNV